MTTRKVGREQRVTQENNSFVIINATKAETEAFMTAAAAARKEAACSVVCRPGSNPCRQVPRLQLKKVAPLLHF